MPTQVLHHRARLALCEHPLHDCDMLPASYGSNGYAVLPGFKPAAELAALRERSLAIVDAYDPGAQAPVFSSTDRARTSDRALIASGSGIHCFFETEAFGPDGRLNRPPRLAVNKIGHAMHDLDPVFDRFFRDPRLAVLAHRIGIRQPLLWQSQVIFKPPGIGGEVRWHQDATFFDTSPQTVTTFWFALEDATRDNGCLWVEPGGHRGPLRELYLRDGEALRTEVIDSTPWPTGGVPLEVEAGTLVVFGGLMPHGSAANRSAVSRMACTLHVSDGAADYSARNWLQRGAGLPVRGFI
jgi:phytanoyl-CoA hydroxylase